MFVHTHTHTCSPWFATVESTMMKGRWNGIDQLITRNGPFTDGFEPDVKIREDFLHKNSRVLVVGAGGLGCELLKDLAMSGFGNIDVIDMDTIDISNLNRQFLFRQADVGKPKATVAADFINSRVVGCTVIPHVCRIQEKSSEFYNQFHIVVCGLDSIEARRWMNSMLHSLVEYDEDGTLTAMIPLVDGGSEGFKGQVRVILPGVSSCFECTMALFPPKKSYPLCTIASTPRLPEHCIEYAKVVLWKEEFGDMPLDTDDIEHTTWLYEQALARAEKYNIKGVTYRLTKGVVKNIIPAVASTNSIIAACCSNETFKLATRCNPHMNNYAFFNLVDGVYAHPFAYEKEPDCIVCSKRPVSITCASADVSLNALMELTMQQLNLKAISGMRAYGSTLYMERPEALRLSTVKNLDRTLNDLQLINRTEVTITADELTSAVVVTIDDANNPYIYVRVVIPEDFTMIL
eukprot:CFRG0573T1